MCVSMVSIDICELCTYYPVQVHTALNGQSAPGMGLDNTWVRDVSVVLPTFTAAIDDVTMAFAERLQVPELLHKAHRFSRACL